MDIAEQVMFTYTFRAGFGTFRKCQEAALGSSNNIIDNTQKSYSAIYINLLQLIVQCIYQAKVKARDLQIDF